METVLQLHPGYILHIDSISCVSPVRPTAKQKQHQEGSRKGVFMLVPSLEESSVMTRSHGGGHEAAEPIASAGRRRKTLGFWSLGPFYSVWDLRLQDAVARIQRESSFLRTSPINTPSVFPW